MRLWTPYAIEVLKRANLSIETHWDTDHKVPMLKQPYASWLYSADAKNLYIEFGLNMLPQEIEKKKLDDAFFESFSLSKLVSSHTSDARIEFRINGTQARFHSRREQNAKILSPFELGGTYDASKIVDFVLTKIIEDAGSK
jgi:hypothetical protein